MTVADLIEVLSKHPPDVEVQVYDPDASAYVPVTGAVFYPITGTVDIFSDD